MRQILLTACILVALAPFSSKAGEQCYGECDTYWRNLTYEMKSRSAGIHLIGYAHGTKDVLWIKEVRVLRPDLLAFIAVLILEQEYLFEARQEALIAFLDLVYKDDAYSNVHPDVAMDLGTVCLRLRKKTPEECLNNPEVSSVLDLLRWGHPVVQGELPPVDSSQWERFPISRP